MSPNTIYQQNILFKPLLSTEKILLTKSLVKGQSIKLIISSYYKNDMKIYEMVKARFFEINSLKTLQR